MLYLTEDKVKAQMRVSGLPVPAGAVVDTHQSAADAASKFGPDVVVKALVATGRRGKAGAVQFAKSPDEAATISKNLIGTKVNGLLCKTVYIEKRIEIKRELYLSFLLEDYPPKLLLSVQGGIDIEALAATNPKAILKFDINPLRGLPFWDAVFHWETGGLDSNLLPSIAEITEKLYNFFVKHDGILLELNPIAIDEDGKPHLVGTMFATEDLMFESKDKVSNISDSTDRQAREQQVIEANRCLPGGMIRYKELNGDIGMFVGGGGAGLHQHDLILKAGGKPANHTDASSVNPDKIRVLIDTILDNPKVKSLFISWHYQQMAQIDKRIIPAIEAIKERGIDPREFPVVIRMFGPNEDLARSAAAEVPGIHYMPHGAPMTDGIELIVKLTAEAQKKRQLGATS